MDKDLMDFWGNLFLNAAKSQKQLEEMTELTRNAFNRFMEWTSSFQKMGLDALTPSAPNFAKEWNNAGDGHQKSFMDGYLRLWGMKASPDEHLQLIRKYEELKEKLASHEETIRHLRLLLDEAKRENLALATAMRHRESNTEMEGQWTKALSSYPT